MGKGKTVVAKVKSYTKGFDKPYVITFTDNGKEKEVPVAATKITKKGEEPGAKKQKTDDSSWLAKQLYEIKEINGRRGLFAICSIKKGQLIGKYGGAVVAQATTQAGINDLVRHMQNDNILVVRIRNPVNNNGYGWIAIDGTNCDMALITQCPNFDDQNVYFSSQGFVRTCADVERGCELVADYSVSHNAYY